MMPNIYIIYRAMFDHNGTMHTIGGIENYILSLCDVFTRQGWPCHIVQPAKKAFTLTTPQYTIHSVTTGLYRGNLKKSPLQTGSVKMQTKITILLFLLPTLIQ